MLTNTPNGTGNMDTAQAVDFLLTPTPDSQTATPDPVEQEPDLLTDTESEENVSENEEIEPEFEAQGDDEGEEYEEADEEQAEKITHVQVGDEELSLEEIEKGYLRQSKFTQEMQRLAVQRQEGEKLDTQRNQELAEIAAEREHLKTMLAHAAKHAKVDEPNWLDLAENDPLEYTRLRAVHDAQQAETNALDAEAQRLQHIENQNNEIRFKEFVNDQALKIVEAIPELKAKDNTAYKASIMTYLEGTAGYSKEELSNMYDSRAVILADKARKYDDLMAGGKPALDKKVKPKGKVLRPGVQKTKAQKTTAQKSSAYGRAKKSGSVNDAVNFLLSK